MLLQHGQAYQGIILVAFAFIKKTEVMCCEGWPIHFKQQGQDMFYVLHSLPSGILTDLAKTDPPTLEQLTLVVREVLVQQDHVEATYAADSGSLSKSAFLA